MLTGENGVDGPPLPVCEGGRAGVIGASSDDPGSGVPSCIGCGVLELIRLLWLCSGLGCGWLLRIWELGEGLRMIRPPGGIDICLYGCWNCWRPAAIISSKTGRNRSTSTVFDPDRTMPRFFNSNFSSVIFISWSRLRSEVAWFTSCGVNNIDLMGVLLRGVPGILEAGDGAEELVWDPEFNDTELLPMSEGEVLLPRDIIEVIEDLVAGRRMWGNLFWFSSCHWRKSCCCFSRRS